MHSKKLFKINSIRTRFFSIIFSYPIFLSIVFSNPILFSISLGPIISTVAFGSPKKKSYQDIENKISILKKKINDEKAFKKKISFLINFKKELTEIAKNNQDPNLDVYLNLFLQALETIPYKNIFNKMNCQKYEKSIYSKIDPNPESTSSSPTDTTQEEVLVTPQTEAANDAVIILSLFCNK